MNFRYLKFSFILFLIVYFLYLVVSNTPAKWAAWGVHKAAPQLWLSSVEGTLWEGKARSAQIDVGPAVIPLGEVRWKLSPLSLFMLSPCVNFSANLPKQQIVGDLCQGVGGSSRIKGLSLDAPVAAFEEILPIDATGLISLQVISAEFNASGKVNAMDARLSWQSARAHTGETWLVLGDFAATAKADGAGGVKAEFFDVSGPYKTKLDATWRGGETWKFKGTIAPQENAAEVVKQGLKILGEEVSDGVFQVQWP